MAGKLRIGEWLVRRGLVSQADVDEALAASANTGARLASQLFVMGLVSEADIIEGLATLLGFPGIDLSRSAIRLEPIGFIPREVAELERILPLQIAGQDMVLAMTDPYNERVIEEVQLISGLSVLPHVALKQRLEKVIPEAYEAADRGEALWIGESLPRTTAEELLALKTGKAEAASAGKAAPFVVSVDVGAGGDEGEEEEVGSVRARPAGRVVLVVDDEEEILKLVRKALESKGFRVEQARRGKEALAKAGEVLPDLILLDANLPEIHGFDVCKQLKANPRFKGIPILLMTAVYRGWRFAEDTRESFGADDYIEKPFHVDDLLRRVDHHLSRSVGEPSRHRERAEQLYDAGVRELEEGRTTKAIKQLEMSLTLDAFNARTHHQLGRALQAAGEQYRAISAYERSVDLRPDHFPTLRSLAALYQQNGFRRKAMEAWERAIPAAPDEATKAKIKSTLMSLL